MKLTPSASVRTYSTWKNVGSLDSDQIYSFIYSMNVWKLLSGKLLGTSLISLTKAPRGISSITVYLYVKRSFLHSWHGCNMWTMNDGFEPVKRLTLSWLCVWQQAWLFAFLSRPEMTCAQNNLQIWLTWLARKHPIWNLRSKTSELKHNDWHWWRAKNLFSAFQFSWATSPLTVWNNSFWHDCCVVNSNLCSLWMWCVSVTSTYQ